MAKLMHRLHNKSSNVYRYDRISPVRQVTRTTSDEIKTKTIFYRECKHQKLKNRFVLLVQKYRTKFLQKQRRRHF